MALELVSFHLRGWKAWVLSWVTPKFRNILVILEKDCQRDERVSVHSGVLYVGIVGDGNIVEACEQGEEV